MRISGATLACFTLSVLLFPVIVTSCDSFVFDDLHILSFSIPEGYTQAKDIPLLAVQFSASPSPFSAGRSCRLFADEISVPGRIQVEGSVISFIPDEAWKDNTDYKFSISSDLETTDGISLRNDKTFLFSTRPERDAPFVVTVNPEDGSVVSQSCKKIDIQFSEPIDQVSFRSNVSFEGDSSPLIIFSDKGDLVSIIPSQSLCIGKRYTITLDSGVLDMHRNSLKDQWTSSFHYGSDSTLPDYRLYVSKDNDPGISELLLSDITISPIFSRLVIECSEEVASDSISNLLEITPPLTYTQHFNKENLRTITYTLSQKPEWGKRYEVCVRKGLADLQGNQFNLDRKYNLHVFREDNRPPKMLALMLEYPDSSTGGLVWHCIDANKDFGDLVLPAEYFPEGINTTIRCVLVCSVSHSSDGISIISAMKAFTIDSKISGCFFSSKTINALSDASDDFSHIREILIFSGLDETTIGKLSMSVCNLEVTNSQSRGVVVFSVTGIKDSLGNEQENSWKVLLNKG